MYVGQLNYPQVTECGPVPPTRFLLHLRHLRHLRHLTPVPGGQGDAPMVVLAEPSRSVNGDPWCRGASLWDTNGARTLHVTCFTLRSAYFMLCLRYILCSHLRFLLVFVDIPSISRNSAYFTLFRAFHVCHEFHVITRISPISRNSMCTQFHVFHVFPCISCIPTYFT